MIKSALLFLVWIVAGPVIADTVKYAYDEAGRLVRVDYGNGGSISYRYDKAGNLLQRVVTSGSAPGRGAKVVRRQTVRKRHP